MLREDVLCPPPAVEPTKEELHKYFDSFKFDVKDGSATLTTADGHTIDLGSKLGKDIAANNEVWFGFNYKGKGYDLDVFTGEEFGTEEGQWAATIYRVSPSGETLTDDEAYSSDVSVEIQPSKEIPMKKTLEANAPKTRKVWARIGMSLPLTDEEYKQWKEKYGAESDLGELDDKDLERFTKEGVVDGESYIPAEVFENPEEYKYSPEEKNAQRPDNDFLEEARKNAIGKKKKDMNLEELEKYAKQAAEQKAALENDTEKGRRMLEEKRKELAKDAKEFLKSLHTACGRIFPEGKAPEILPFSPESEEPALDAEVLPGKADPSKAEPFEIPGGVSVGINQKKYQTVEVAVKLVYSENDRMNKTIYIGKNYIDLYSRGRKVDDAFYDGELSTEELKWIVDNKDVIEKSFSMTVEKAMDLSLDKARKEKEETDRRLGNMMSKTSAEVQMAPPATARRPQGNAAYNMADAIDYLRGWIEHAELEGIPEGGRRENATAFLDRLERDMRQAAARTPPAPGKGRTAMTEKTYRKMKGTMEWMRSCINGAYTGGQQVKNSMILLDQFDRLIDRKWEKERPRGPARAQPGPGADSRRPRPDSGIEF
jgi:hypothetical protein